MGVDIFNHGLVFGFVSAVAFCLTRDQIKANRAKHLAKRIIDLIQLDYKGVINLASLNKVSKYDFLTCIATYAGFSKAIIHESSIAGINSSIPRPKNTTLNINHANKILELPTISEGIEDLIKDLKKEANYERD